MSSHTVVFRAGPSSHTGDEVAERLRAGGVKVVDEQPNMLLVSGSRTRISKALGNAQGWSLTAETRTPHPDVRKSVLKPPSGS
ncbi:hypothetical protein [Rhodopseudomonas sp. AAP120]|uniref:hypothetical protein n=1 Tax=Rhodopseudomonas sp. AAP120 TaxID=1523430 RepID=UPI000AD8E4CB|nr:hypothetical protein [Rhodopseudomonas sp. AAP120]